MYYEQDQSDAPDYRMLSSRRVTARKAHVCGHCKKVIGAGQEYYRTAGIYDGEFFAERTHTKTAACLDFSS